MRRLLALLALVVAAAVVFSPAALQGGDERAQSGAPPGVLRIVSDQDVDSLDPAHASSPVSLPLVFSTCALLVNQPGDPVGPQPEVAAALPKISADGRTYVFTIRRGFRFSDGSPVTAASFAEGIRRVLDPATRSRWAEFATDVEAVTARGSALTVRLRRRAGDLLARLTMPWACPVPRGTPPAPQGIDDVPGSGPYYVRSREEGRRVVLARNPHYGGERPRRSTRIVLTVTGSPASNARAVEAGRFDWWLYYWFTPPPPGALIERLTARYGVDRGRFFVGPALGTLYVALNTARPLFGRSVRLRRAVNVTLDRPAILREWGVPPGPPTDRLLPPSMPGFVDARVVPRGAPEARAARQLAGDRSPARRAVLWIQDEPLLRRVAQVIRAQLGAIGLDVRIRPLAHPVIKERSARRGARFDLILGAWGAFYPDPMEFLGRLLDGRRIRADRNYNLSYFNAPEVNRRLDAADALGVPRRYPALARLEAEILRRYAPVAPIFHPNTYVLVSDRVGCVEADGVMDPGLGDLCLR